MGNSAVPSDPTRAALGVDTHVHVLRVDAPLVAGRHSTPSRDTTVAELLALLDAHGLSHAVVAAPSFYGSDNRVLLDALRTGDGRLLGTVSVEPTTGVAELDRLADQGVVGIRLNWRTRRTWPGADLAAHRRLFAAAAHSGLHGGAANLATHIPAALFLGTFAGALVLGRLADRIGRGRAFTLNLSMLAIGCVATVLTPVSAGFGFLVAMFLAGVGTGAEIPLSVTYAQEMAAPRRRGRTSSWVLTCGFVGGTVRRPGRLRADEGIEPAPARPAHQLPDRGRRRGHHHRAALAIPESPLWLERTGRDADAERSLRRMESGVQRDLGGAELPAVVPVDAGADEASLGTRRSTLDLLHPEYRRTTISAWLIELAQGFGAYGFITFVPTILFARGLGADSDPGRRPPARRLTPSRRPPGRPEPAGGGGGPARRWSQPCPTRPPAERRGRRRHPTSDSRGAALRRGLPHHGRAARPSSRRGSAPAAPVSRRPATPARPHRRR